MKDHCQICDKLQRKHVVKMDEIIGSTKAIVSALYDNDDLDPKELEYDIQDLCFALGISIPTGSIKVKRKEYPSYTQRIFSDLIKATNNI